VVATAEENALGHTLGREVDDLGRVVVSEDANGVRRIVGTDAFGRVTSEHRQGSDSVVVLPVRVVSYHDEGVPNWVETVTFALDAEGGISGVVNEYDVLITMGRFSHVWSGEGRISQQ
jgi:YD repeat-containing protein